MRLYTVYRLISPSGKSYIGQTIRTPDARWKSHVRGFNDWKRNGRPSRKGSTRLLCAFEKYPPETWKLEILRESLLAEEIDAIEIALIAEYDAVNCGYNMSLGGSGTKGYKHSDATRQKLSNRQLGKPKSPETRAKISAAKTGQKLSSEHRAKITASCRARARQ